MDEQALLLHLISQAISVRTYVGGVHGLMTAEKIEVVIVPRGSQGGRDLVVYTPDELVALAYDGGSIGTCTVAHRAKRDELLRNEQDAIKALEMERLVKVAEISGFVG